MNKFNIENIVKANTSEDGIIDWKVINAVTNEQINNVIAKKTVNTDELKATNTKEFLEKNGFKDMSAFEKFVNDTNGKSPEMLKALEKEFNAYKEKTANYGDLEKYKTASERKAVAKKSNIDNKFVELAVFNAEKRISEDVDFDTAFKQELEENGKDYSIQISSTGSKATGVDSGNKEEWEIKLEERNNIKL